MLNKTLQTLGWLRVVPLLHKPVTNVSNCGAPTVGFNACNNRKMHKDAHQPEKELSVPNYLQFEGNWPEHEKHLLVQDMRIITDFLSEEEESKMLEEVEPYLKRLRYEFDHWDDAIHGFRETERKHWYPHNRTIIERVRETAFKDGIMPFVHVLDLAEDGVIKPHVDSTRYCGSTIAGLSLLSDCVMRLVRTDEKKYKQDGNDDDNYRSQPTQEETLSGNNFLADILLKRRSLYIMNNTARYNFTHEILGNTQSTFQGRPVHKTRRISIICRNEP